MRQPASPPVAGLDFADVAQFIQAHHSQPESVHARGGVRHLEGNQPPVDLDAWKGDEGAHRVELLIRALERSRTVGMSFDTQPNSIFPPTLLLAPSPKQPNTTAPTLSTRLPGAVVGLAWVMAVVGLLGVLAGLSWLASESSVAWSLSVRVALGTGWLVTLTGLTMIATMAWIHARRTDTALHALYGEIQRLRAVELPT